MCKAFQDYGVMGAAVGCWLISWVLLPGFIDLGGMVFCAQEASYSIASCCWLRKTDMAGGVGRAGRRAFLKLWFLELPRVPRLLNLGPKPLNLNLRNPLNPKPYKPAKP